MVVEDKTTKYETYCLYNFILLTKEHYIYLFAVWKITNEKIYLISLTCTFEVFLERRRNLYFVLKYYNPNFLSA